MCRQVDYILEVHKKRLLIEETPAKLRMIWEKLRRLDFGGICIDQTFIFFYTTTSVDVIELIGIILL